MGLPGRMAARGRASYFRSSRAKRVEHQGWTIWFQTQAAYVTSAFATVIPRPTTALALALVVSMPLQWRVAPLVKPFQGVPWRRH